MSRVGKSKFQLIEVEVQDSLGSPTTFELQVYYVKRGANVGTFVTERQVVYLKDNCITLPPIQSTDILQIHNDAKRIAEGHIKKRTISFRRFLNVSKCTREAIPDLWNLLRLYDQGGRIALNTVYLGSTEDGCYFKANTPTKATSELTPINAASLERFREEHLEVTDEFIENLEKQMQQVFIKAGDKINEQYREFKEEIQLIIDDFLNKSAPSAESLSESPLTQILRTYSK